MLCPTLHRRAVLTAKTPDRSVLFVFIHSGNIEAKTRNIQTKSIKCTSLSPFQCHLQSLQTQLQKVVKKMEMNKTDWSTGQVTKNSIKRLCRRVYWIMTPPPLTSASTYSSSSSTQFPPHKTNELYKALHKSPALILTLIIPGKKCYTDIEDKGNKSPYQFELDYDFIYIYNSTTIT